MIYRAITYYTIKSNSNEIINAASSAEETAANIKDAAILTTIASSGLSSEVTVPLAVDNATRNLPMSGQVKSASELIVDKTSNIVAKNIVGSNKTSNNSSSRLELLKHHPINYTFSVHYLLLALFIF